MPNVPRRYEPFRRLPVEPGDLPVCEVHLSFPHGQLCTGCGKKSYREDAEKGWRYILHCDDVSKDVIAMRICPEGKWRKGKDGRPVL